MNIRRWSELLPDEFHVWGSVNAYPYDPRGYIDVLREIQAMTTPSNMHLLNLAVRCMAPNECYMEVGTWRGSTLIGALLGNEASGYAVDNDSMNDHDGDDRSSYDVWRENIARFGMADRTVYIDSNVQDVWDQDFYFDDRVGVYLFDGDKSTDEAAYAGLAGVLPFLADEALIFVDDANDIHIRRAVHQFCDVDYRGHTVKVLDIPTPGNCWPCFWNGVIAIAWKR